MENTIVVIPQLKPFNQGVEFALFIDGPKHSSQAVSIEFKNMEPFEECKEPLFATTVQQTQDLMNALWQLGFRPTNEIGYEGQLEAVKKHLEDMRTLVFNPMKRE